MRAFSGGSNWPSPSTSSSFLSLSLSLSLCVCVCVLRAKREEEEEDYRETERERKRDKDIHFSYLGFCISAHKKFFSPFFLYLLEKRYTKKGEKIHTRDIHHTGFLTRTRNNRERERERESLFSSSEGGGGELSLLSSSLS